MTSCTTPEDADTLAPALPDDLIDSAVTLLEAAAGCGCTLATAESCTGGLLASLLTDIEGTGHLFDRGFVTYSDASKSDLLGVAAELIADEGAVSEPVARAMAEGALHRSEAAVAIAITGFAGKGDPSDEVGLVHPASRAAMVLQCTGSAISAISVAVLRGSQHCGSR
jgi:nicotinamide-nucleotide amidase